ncbi:MAG: hypothetical protein ACT6QS_02300 [Flavobacteriales bacterium]
MFNEEKLDIISKLFFNHQTSFIWENNKFILNPTSEEENNEIRSYCDQYNISIDIDGSLKIKSYINISLLFYIDSFTQYFEIENINDEFIILDTAGNYCIVNQHDSFNYTWKKNIDEQFKNKTQNILYYYKFYRHITSSNFADHHNDANTEIVIYSSARGILKITYSSIPQIESTEWNYKMIDLFIEMSEKIEIKPFIKNSLFAFSEDHCIISVDSILVKIREIVEASERDFDLVSKKFNFEEFRDKLLKEKDKYFSNLREIISKIFSQAIGIPISISATIFATYKVSESPLTLLIILLSFILYTAFYIRIQILYKRDIRELEKDFLSDFEIIKLNSGLPESSINDEKNKIEIKFSNYISITNWLIFLVISLALLVCLFIIQQLCQFEFSILKKIFLIIFEIKKIIPIRFFCSPPTTLLFCLCGPHITSVFLV